jgi:hypothetical protein
MGLLPTATVADTALVAVSMTDTVASADVADASAKAASAAR